MRIFQNHRHSCVILTLSGAALACLPGCSGNPNSEGVGTTLQANTVAPTQQIQLSFMLPAAAVLDSTVVGAAKSVRIADRSQLFGDLVTNGGAAVLAAGVKVGNLLVNGDATLGSGSQVFGNVAAQHLIKSASATVSGTVTESDAPPPTAPVKWTVTVSTTSLGDINLGPDQSRDLAPGRYQRFSVKSRSTVTLHSGVYRLADFLLEPQARLVIDDSNGPVQVIVDGNFTYRGAIIAGHLPFPQLLFVVRGTVASVEAPFVGALLAPGADVRLQASLPEGHRAFVFGSTVALEPDTKVNALPFDWPSVGSDFVPKPPPEACFIPVAASQPCPARGRRTAIWLPKGISPEDVALLASSTLTLGSGAKANDALVNLGHWETSLGSSAWTGGIWSEAATVLGNSARVAGGVFSHSTVSIGSQVQVTGPIVQNTALNLAVPSLWLPLFPTNHAGAVAVATNTTKNLAPGDYGAVTLGTGATLSLQGGTYTFDSLSSSAGSTILTAARDTPLLVHVRQGFTLRGRVTRPPDANQGVLFTYAGKNGIALKQPFQGTLAAPFAFLQLGASADPHRGAFFANGVALAAGAVVQHVPFGSWAALPQIEDSRRGPLPTIQTRKTAGPPPSVDSTPASAEAFVAWLVASSKADLPAARDALDQVADKSAATANLVQLFNGSRKADSTRATLILNAIGYLRTAGSEALFTSLVNEPLPVPSGDGLEGVQELRQLERYQTSAVHGLAFMHSGNGDALLKALMTNHPSAQTRSEAVRSFLFHNPTTNRAALGATLRPDEAYLSDRFENRNAGSTSNFDERLSAYLAKHPQL
ncbi:MAG TPA: hypothetical protein VJV79_37800 [Polyangiaceae bacterium]|nr:hypothetical protein [Polyangiaceae bacterium]